MKAKLNSTLVLMLCVFFSYSVNAQKNAEKIKGYYTGFKNNTYTFSYTEEATGNKETIEFQYAKPELIETFSLKNDFFEGVFFEISYFTSSINGKHKHRIVNLKEIKEGKVKKTNTTEESSKEVNPEKLDGYFMGFKNNKYSFSYTEKATGEKETVYFDDISDRVSKDYDLQQEFFEGVHFEVTYIADTVNGKIIYIIVGLIEVQESEK
ncbi:hypothetical protein ACOSP6_06940 [Tenacibaculum sp. MEBiC06402]|uniref:hypothetical protein n=1 Tax=unclassified Tenacibaculum TaxID=2635139 RepID=UPI003B997E0D